MQMERTNLLRDVTDSELAKLDELTLRTIKAQLTVNAQVRKKVITIIVIM